MTLRILFSLVLATLVLSCSSDNDNTPSSPEPVETSMYFPPLDSDAWETENISDLGWNQQALTDLLNFLDDTNTKSFIILYKGRLVTEAYFNGADASTNSPWYSAGKTLTAFTFGIAQENGYLNLQEPSNTYLGSGWSSLTEDQESAITIEDHLQMTTGLDYTQSNLFCTDAECLNYLNPAGTFWFYHNAPYTLSQSIISGAVGDHFDVYFKQQLRDRIGMQGAWLPSGYNRFYYSTARSMARFGLLCLNEGLWDGISILEDTNYFKDMTTSSQNHNKAYGYLWWLNGKESFRLPNINQEFSGTLFTNAPNDLIAGLGAQDQKLYVVPSKDLVIIRQGGNGSNNPLGPSSYDNDLWAYITALIN